MSAPQDIAENVCVVCFKTVDIYSIGECDHPVCYECSTRMRVLCLQIECPICRQDLSKVIFTSTCEPYKKINSQVFRNNSFEKKYKICFSDDNVRESYQKLLEHNCTLCTDAAGPFRNFGALKDHLRKEHELFFCDLCVENLKIFTCERKSYTRTQLAHHRRKGDPDDTSHKGHPLCEFCDARYMDTDELFRHLRKDHLYCHLCDADGFHHYYGSHNALREHFRKDHYLCEEGECGEQHLTGVFRSDIDLKAHKASEHGKGLSKQAARQARTLELQFRITPRPLRGPPPPHHNNHARHITINEPENAFDSPPEEPYVAPSKTIDMESTEQFPNLGGAGGPMVSMSRPLGTVIRQTPSALVRTQENFPSLAGDAASAQPTFRVNITHQPGPSSAIIRTTAKPNVHIQVHNHSSSGNRYSVSETSNKQLAMRMADKKEALEESRKFQEEFPSLSKKDKALLMNDYCSPITSNAVTKRATPPPQPAAPKPAPVQKPPPPSLEAFPALQAGNGPAPAPAQWITLNKPKDKPPKPSKVAPVPQIPSDIHLDFPSLAINKKNKKSEKTSNSSPRPIEEPQGALTKKDKKKIKTNDPPEASPPENFKGKKNGMEHSVGIETGKKKSTTDQSTNELKDKKKNVQNGAKTEDRSSASKVVSTSKQKPPQIEASNKAVEISNSEKDFPSLNGVKNPPGFKAKSIITPPGLARPTPPPGFHGSVPPCNGFTFTNSSGQNYNIPIHNYVQPSNFNLRNKSLVANFIKVLDSHGSIHEFKQLSQMFREGTYSAESYYEHCVTSMGDDFNEIFPELLVLLPDISKQQELHNIYSNNNDSKLTVCSTCGQVLAAHDTDAHAGSHNLHSHFPALPPSPMQAPPVWRK